MSGDLLPYYNRELSYLRKLGKEFALAYPDVAPLLRIDAEAGQDPYVERLIEAVAYLNARTRKKLDDDFPELSEALLGVLYPHYLAPIPPMAIAQFELDKAQGGMVIGHAIPRGAQLETEEVAGESCAFRTAADLRLFPLRVADVSLTPLSRTPSSPRLREAVEVLRIKLASFGEAPLSAMKFDTLRFYLAGETLHANGLYELIFNDAVGVAVATSSDDPEPILLPKGCLQPVGFARDEALLPTSPRSFEGYRLLTEYFALPERYRFFALQGLLKAAGANAGMSLEVQIYVRTKREDLHTNLSADSVRLGCVPIVNLFEQRADPFRLTQARSAYHVVPDVRRPEALEIYSVDEVVATDRDGQTIPIQPFYSVSHSLEREPRRAFWYAARRPGGLRRGRDDSGTEIDLSLVDLQFSPSAPADWTITVQTTCLNRDLPAQLPVGGGRPRMKLLAGGPLAPIRLVTPPTPTRRRPQRHGVLWRLISHLSLNQISLVQGPEGAATLREILSLYEHVGSAEHAARISGLQQVRARRKTARIISGNASGFCRGVEVEVDFDEQRFADGGLYLFASVLERFLGLYASINSFSQLTVRSSQREGIFCQWPPRAAELQLL